MTAVLRRLAASLMLVAFAGTLALPLVSSTHLRWNDDPDCNPLGVGPRNVAIVFKDLGTTGPSGHCPLCHWLRALAGADLAPRPHAVPALGETTPTISHMAWWHGRLAAPARASRAPPAVLPL